MQEEHEPGQFARLALAITSRETGRGKEEIVPPEYVLSAYSVQSNHSTIAAALTPQLL
jgi:hypothetical protein